MWLKNPTWPDKFKAFTPGFLTVFLWIHGKASFMMAVPKIKTVFVRGMIDIFSGGDLGEIKKAIYLI